MQRKQEKETRNGYIHLAYSKSKDEKHWPPNASKSWAQKCKGHWRKKYWGEKETLASKYRAAKAGHISAKGNGRKKLMGRKENIGLQIPGSKSWTHKCKGHWRKDYWGLVGD